VPTGKIEVRLQTTDGLDLLWSEMGGPLVKEPSRKGFGVDAIDGVIRTLKGNITRDWKPDGLVCKLSFLEVAL